MSSSTVAANAPLVSLAVYCPLLSQDREERALDNVLFFSPREASPNRQMNFVGFCIATSSLAARFGVQHSNRHTIRKQRSSVCLYSPLRELWVGAHVRGGYGEAETTHQLLHLSVALFQLLYGRRVLARLTGQPREDATGSSSTTQFASAAHHEAREKLPSFFSRCASFVSWVLAAQQRERGGTPASWGRPSPAMSSQQWASYLCSEAALGYPLHHVSAQELPPRQIGAIEDVVDRLLWARACSGPQRSADLPRCCVLALPSLRVLLADSRLSATLLRALKLYLMLYAPITSSSFTCHDVDEMLHSSSDGTFSAAAATHSAAATMDVAVWREGSVLVVLIAAPSRTLEASMRSASSETNRSAASTTHTWAMNGEGVGASLLECASAIGAEVSAVLQRCAAGLMSAAEKERFWLSTCDATQHEACYAAHTPAPAPGPTPSPPLVNTLILRLRLSGGVVEGTPLLKVWPVLVEHMRTLIASMRPSVAAAAAADATWACWTRWSAVWIYLRFDGGTVTVLASRSPVDMRLLLGEAKRVLTLPC